MARLRRGFEARVERRRRKQAARITYGRRLSVEQDLGQLGDVFQLHHTSWWWGPVSVPLLLLLIFGIPALVTYGVVAEDLTSLERSVIALPLMVGSWVTAIFLLLRTGRDRNPGHNEWVYCCDAGLIYVCERARAVRVIRWDQVVAVYRAWVTKFSPSEEDWYPVPAGPVLALDGGATLSLTGGYKNVLDPWPSMRGGFEAMRPVGEVLPRFPSLAEALERAVTARLLPLAMAAYERGEVVWFGPVGVGWQGITVAQAQEALAWTEFGGLAQGRQALVLWRRQPGGQPPGPGVECESRSGALQDAVHNLRVLFASAGLVPERSSAGRGTGPGDAWQILDVGSIPNLCVLEAMLAQLEAGGGTVRT